MLLIVDDPLVKRSHFPMPKKPRPGLEVWLSVEHQKSRFKLHLHYHVVFIFHKNIHEKQTHNFQKDFVNTCAGLQ